MYGYLTPVRSTTKSVTTPPTGPLKTVRLDDDIYTTPVRVESDKSATTPPLAPIHPTAIFPSDASEPGTPALPSALEILADVAAAQPMGVAVTFPDLGE